MGYFPPLTRAINSWGVSIYQMQGTVPVWMGGVRLPVCHISTWTVQAGPANGSDTVTMQLIRSSDSAVIATITIVGGSIADHSASNFDITQAGDYEIHVNGSLTSTIAILRSTNFQIAGNPQ